MFIFIQVLYYVTLNKLYTFRNVTELSLFTDEEKRYLYFYMWTPHHYFKAIKLPRHHYIMYTGISTRTIYVRMINLKTNISF